MLKARCPLCTKAESLIFRGHLPELCRKILNKRHQNGHTEEVGSLSLRKLNNNKGKLIPREHQKTGS